MELLLSKLDEKLNQQAMVITNAVTKNVMEALDEKMKLITEENHILKSKVSDLEQKLRNMEQDKRKNNLVFFGVQELGKSEIELVDNIKEIITDMGVYLDSHEISNLYKIGKRSSNKNRPVVVSITTMWKKRMILKNKSNLPSGIYVMEDCSKEVLETRKQLKPQLEEEKKKGNIAFLIQDKLIVKKPTDKNREKRKREGSDSPKSLSSQKKINKHATHPSPNAVGKEVVRPGILNYVERKRPASVSETSKN